MVRIVHGTGTHLENMTEQLYVACLKEYSIRFGVVDYRRVLLNWLRLFSFRLK